MLPTLELEAKRKSFLYGLLEAIGQQLDPTETQYERASTSYDAVGLWLTSDDSEFLRNSQILSHGSVRIQTVNRPWLRTEFDVDALHLLPNIVPSCPPAVVKKLTGDRLKLHERYRPMLVEKNRCWQLQYAGEFHMDITPAIPNPDCPNGGLLVPDKALEKWKTTNPISYANRFEERARLQPRYRMVKLASADAGVEGLPKPQRYKGVLKRSTQLAKRNRDIEFCTNDATLAPISVIITTLLAWSYEQCVLSCEFENELDLLIAAVRGMPNFIHVSQEGSRTLYLVPNETTAGENFAEKWNANPRLATAFYRWHSNFVVTLEQFAFLDGEDLLSEHLSKAFGATAVQRVFANMNDATNASRAVGRLGIIAGAGVASSSRAAAVRPNTFYGR